MKSFPAIHAVLTGDIVNSTKLNAVREDELTQALKNTFKPYKYEFYRGDSFQVYLKDALPSLRLALLCRTQAIAISGEEEYRSDVRIGIGIGEVLTPVKSLGMAKGEAFVLSGRSLDSLQEVGKKTNGEGRLAIVSGHAIADTGFLVIAGHIDAIYKRMTAKQAEVITGLLKGQTQVELTLGLRKSGSTISQLVSSGGWPAIERLLQQYELLINQLYDDRIGLADKVNHRTSAD